MPSARRSELRSNEAWFTRGREILWARFMKFSFVICGARLWRVTDGSLIGWPQGRCLVSPRCEQAVIFTLARSAKSWWVLKAASEQCRARTQRNLEVEAGTVRTRGTKCGRTTPPTPGVLYGCERKRVAGKGVCNTMKTKGGQNSSRHVTKKK